MLPVGGPTCRVAVRVLPAAIVLVFAIVLSQLVAPRAEAGAVPLQTTPTPTLTPALPPPPPTPTTVPPTPVPPSVRVCPQIVRRVPAAAINAAIANPGRIGGYNLPRDPGKREGPHNPLRTWLSIHCYHKPYHPLYNSLEFKVGCP